MAVGPLPFIIVIIFGFAALVVYRWRRRELYRLAAKIPGPKGWPIIGNAFIFLGIKTMEGIVDKLREMSNDHYSGITKSWAAYRLCVFVSEPECIEALLNHPSARWKDEMIYGPLSIGVGAGIFTRNGEKWLRLRKGAVKMFHPKSIVGFDDRIEKRLVKLCNILDTKTIGGEEFDIHDYILLYSLDLFIETGMGLEMNELSTNSLNFPHAIEEVLTRASLSIVSVLTFLNINPSIALKKCCRNLTEKMAKLMGAREEIKNQGDEKNYADVVMEVGEIEGLNFYETCKIANDILIAGSHTSSSVIGGTILMIAIHQDVQEKLYQEMKDIFGDSDRPADKTNIDNMKYLDMCINEGLRHFGPLVTARRIESNVQLGDYMLPEGSTILLSHSYVANKPEYWEKPESFYPEHFTAEAKQSRPKGAFLPFNTGPRGCPGKLYAMQVMKRTISTLVRRYHLTSNLKYEDVIYKFSLLRVPSNPLVKLSRRNPLK